MEQTESLTKKKTAERSHVICFVCKLNESIYCCPSCGTRTCSLECCLSHKKASDCSGKRDRTAFISKEKFRENNQNLISDYHFLEDALLVNRRAKRILDENTFSKKKHTKKAKSNWRNTSLLMYEDDSRQNRNINWFDERFNEQRSDCSIAQNLLLRNAFDRSNIKILFMPAGMDRHKRNKSYFHIKSSMLLWTIEFIFHSSPRNDALDQKVILDRIKDGNKIVDELKNAIEVSGHTSSQLNYSSSSIDEYYLFMKIEPSISSNQQFRKLDPSLSFRDGIKDMNLIEYPTIYVTHKSGINLFPSLIQDISS